MNGKYGHLGLMTVREFLAWSSIGRTKTYEEIRAGRLRALKVGRKTLIDYSDAREWAMQQPRMGSSLNPQQVYGSQTAYLEDASQLHEEVVDAS